MIELTKEQTIKIYIDKSKKNHLKRKYTINTKIKWYCLHCLSIIYVAYTNSHVSNIFCCNCWKFKKHAPTQIQFQYLRVMKEKQLEIIENRDYSNMLKLVDTEK